MGKHYIRESERYQLEVLLQEKYTIKQIADILGHKYHTIYHEIKRGTVKQLTTHWEEIFVYKADYAQKCYDEQISNRGRNLKIGNDHEFAQYIETMIRDKKYSPEALLLKAKSDNRCFQSPVCFKTIYNYLDMGLFLGTANSDLPYKKIRKKKKPDNIKISMHNLRGTSIENRPPYISHRKEYGHWEMDTVYSAKEQGKSCLLVLSERMSRKELVFKIPDRTSKSVIRALNAYERKIGSKTFSDTFKTITCDNGVEFLDFASIERSIRTKSKRTRVYYCHAYSSWERGTNENINRMIRRIFPKGTSFDMVTKQQVQEMQDWINNYPRKILGGLSSHEFLKSKGLAIV